MMQDLLHDEPASCPVDLPEHKSPIAPFPTAQPLAELTAVMRNIDCSSTQMANLHPAQQAWWLPCRCPQGGWWAAR